MSLADLAASIDAHNRIIVYRETWGHLDALPGDYPGHITFVLGCHGDITLLEWDFDKVESNPWIYIELNQFIGAFCVKTDREWGVWRFEGIYRRFKNGKSKFAGKTRPCQVSYRFNGKRVS